MVLVLRCSSSHQFIKWPCLYLDDLWWRPFTNFPSCGRTQGIHPGVLQSPELEGKVLNLQLSICNLKRHGISTYASGVANLCCYQLLQGIFERFDRDRSGKIDANELREALLSLGFSVSPAVLDLLVSKFDKSGGKNRAIEYDNFIEYVPCLVSA